jgi:Zn-dependent peptidase ImmA (M78 family)
VTTTDVTIERTRVLIDESGLTQTEFATRAGLDASKMSKSLSGVRRFSSLDLARIAQLGNVTVDWLLGADAMEAAAAGRFTSAKTDAVDQAVGAAGGYARLRDDLVFLGYPQPTLPSVGSAPKGRLIDQGAQLAERARALVLAAGADTTERYLVEVVEQVFGIDVGVVDLPAGFDGLAWRDDDVRLILMGTSQTPARQRFTLAHELAHVLAHDDQALHVDPDITRLEPARKGSEMRANAFAASFLMPESAIPASAARSDQAFAELADQLSVSPETLAWRMFSLGLLPAGTRDSLRSMTALRAAQIAGTAGRFSEWLAVSARPRVPGLLARDSFQSYVDGSATLRPYAQLIGVDVDSLRTSIEDAVGEPVDDS